MAKGKNDDQKENEKPEAKTQLVKQADEGKHEADKGNQEPTNKKEEKEKSADEKGKNAKDGATEKNNNEKEEKGKTDKEKEEKGSKDEKEKKEKENGDDKEKKQKGSSNEEKKAADKKKTEKNDEHKGAGIVIQKTDSKEGQHNVVFKVPSEKKPTWSDIKLQNPTNENKTFKVKCTSAVIFRVQPPFGFIKANETTKIRLYFQNTDGIPTDGKKHYFAIYFMKSQDEKKDAKELWNKDSKPEGVCRINAVFEKKE